MFLKNIFAVTAVVILTWGLEYKRQFLFSSSFELIEAASRCFLFGAALLAIPALIDWRRSDNQETKNFGLLIFLLQVFVVFSASLPMLSLQFLSVLLLEVVAVVLVVTAIESRFKLLPEFRWTNLVSPNYYWQVASGKFSSAEEITVGIIFLAFGYAFVRFPGLGDITLLLGAIFLALSALREFQVRKQFFAGVILAMNLVFIIYGVIFIYMFLS